MLRIKRTILIALFVVIVLLIGAFVVMKNAISIDAYAETMLYYSDEQYTDDDKLLNPDGTSSDRSIIDFANSVNRAVFDSIQLELANVIPLKYLKSTEISAVYQYFGKEYGFYVVKEDNVFDILLIDFVYDLDNDTLSDIEQRIRINPILQCSFIRYVENGEYVWRKYQWYDYCYYIANPRFAVALYNENALNYGDKGYSKLNDDGLIISQYRINYQNASQVNDNKTKVLTNFLAHKVFDISCDVMNALTFGVGGTIMSVMGDVIQVNDDLYSSDTSPSFLANTENQVTTNMSKIAQKNNPELNGYSRVVGFASQSNETIILSNNGDSYAEFITVLNNVDYKSRLTQLCEFDIVRRLVGTGAPEYVTSTDQNAFLFYRESVLFEDQQPKFEIDANSFDGATIPIYLLPHGEQEISFTPKHSGVYSFEIPSNTELSLDGDARNSFILLEGQTYRFKIVGQLETKITGQLQCKVERFSQNNIYSVLANANHLICYFPNDTAYKKVVASNSNVKIGLLDENFNAIVFADNDYLYYNFIEGQKYYFTVNNDTQVDNSTSITVNDLPNISLGEFKIVEQERVMAFKNEYSKLVNYQLITESPEDLSAVVTDKFNNVLSNNYEYIDNQGVYRFSLLPNEVCYIQFCGNINSSSMAALRISQHQCQWIVNDKVEQTSVKLKPNCTHTIALAVVVDGVVIDTLDNFNVSTTVWDYRYSAGKLFIGNIANGKEIHLSTSYVQSFSLIVIVDDMIRTINLMHCNGTADYDVIAVELNQIITVNINKPKRNGFEFLGYFTAEGGQGTKYIDCDMQGNMWDIDLNGATLYAHWKRVYYTIIIHSVGEFVSNDIPIYVYVDNRAMPEVNFFAPQKSGYAFDGFFSEPQGKGIKYYKMEFENSPAEAAALCYDVYWREKPIPCGIWNLDEDGELFTHFVPLTMSYSYARYEESTYKHLGTSKSLSLTHGKTITIKAEEIEGYTFEYFVRGAKKITETEFEYTAKLSRSGGSKGVSNDLDIRAFYGENKCISQGTLITLANGTQVPVESLKGDEMLLVWNMITGRLDAARIMFVDTDKAATYKVINLGFSDGTNVKVISEHGFWDYDLNKFVYLRSDASKYIGHWFNKGDVRVQLTSVEVRDEYTTAYSPVTYGHLCYFVNGMLSMPGGIDGLFNIFEVDPNTMTIDAEAMARDIATYGLFTYDEFAELVSVTEDVFSAFNGQYFKVAIGKGMITVEQLNNLADRYAEFFV